MAHERERTQSETAAVFVVVGVVEVGNAKHMGEFVAEGADSAHVRTAGAPEFRGAGIRAEMHPVVDHVPVAVGKAGSVGPDGVFAAPFGLVVPGVIEEDVVYGAILVVVVIGEIHQPLRVRQGTGLGEQFARVLVISVIVVGTVVTSFL